MAWQSVLPPDPIAARWWHPPVDPPPETPPVTDHPEWKLPAHAARAGRYLRDLDAVLAVPEPCDCVAEGYRAGCVRCRGVDRRHTGPAPGHGIEARWASELAHSGAIGQVLSVR
jgi:hypothetical protein